VKIITIASDPDSIGAAVKNAIHLINEGETVIVPTETAYGLAVDASNAEALSRLFELKRRGKDKPSAIFVRSPEQISRYAQIDSPAVLATIHKLWPGPVTFVMKARTADWPGIVSSGKIGLRCSSHPFIRKLTESCHSPLTATSANVSGEMVNSVDNLKKIFGDHIKLFILDPDLNLESPPSTVVEISDNRINILREGKINTETIRKIFNDVNSE
jgi:L-threonylcarbamoyladenylate synthase